MSAAITKRAIILGVVVFVVTSAARAAIPDELRNSMSQCGINALYSCMRYLGIELPLDELYSNIPRGEDNAVNLFQLSQHAGNCGLYTKPVEYPTLAALKKHLSGNSSAMLQYRYPNGRSHIVALLPCNGDIWLFDVPLRKFTISDEDLQRLLRQSEGMVVVSKTPFPRPMIGQISLSRRSWVFVFITSLALLTATAFWIRQGSAQR